MKFHKKKYNFLSVISLGIFPNAVNLSFFSLSFILSNIDLCSHLLGFNCSKDAFTFLYRAIRCCSTLGGGTFTEKFTDIHLKWLITNLQIVLE